METRNNYTGGVRNADASLYLAGFMGDSIVDGPGLRCVLFCQGCPHNCAGCQNPATHPFEGGTSYTVKTLLEKIHGYPLCHAVTFSGGEPFCQAEPLAELAEALKAEGYELAAYTGYTFEELVQGSAAHRLLLSRLDTLVDGKYLMEEQSLELRFRGSRNQRVLDIPRSLSAGGPVWETEERWTGHRMPRG